MASGIKEKIYTLIDEELKTAAKRFGMNQSNHESFEVIREELDGIREDTARLEAWAWRIWNATRNSADGVIARSLYEEIYEAAADTAVKTIQVAAMARKAIISNTEITKPIKFSPTALKAVEACEEVAAWRKSGNGSGQQDGGSGDTGGQIMHKDSVEKMQKGRIQAELLKIGIRTDEDLREAIRKLPPLQIGIMADQIMQKQRKGVGVYG